MTRCAYCAAEHTGRECLACKVTQRHLGVGTCPRCGLLSLLGGVHPTCGGEP